MKSAFFILAAFVVCWSMASSISIASEEMVLKLEAVQDEFVIREPVKFILTLSNVSDRTLRIQGVEEFKMGYPGSIYMEIITPRKERQYRRVILESVTYLIDYDNYTGDALPPGASVEIFRYPCISTTMPHPKSDYKAGETGITFSEPGTYQVRYVYCVSPRFKKLWKGKGGELYSNPITITLREPTQEEKEILDAIWDQGEFELGFGSIISRGDDVVNPIGDREALRRVIRLYPNNPMIRYAYFYLAMWLLDIGSSNTESRKEAVSILEMLRARFPEYRYEEVGQHLGVAYSQLGMRERAVQIFAEVIEKHPSIIYHYRFMRDKNYAETHSTRGIAEWRRKRRTGELYLKGE